MFVRYFVEVPFPMTAVEDALLRDPERWTPGLVQEAQARGEAMLVEVGFGPPGHRIEKRVTVELGVVQRFPSKAVLPMTWSPVGLDHLFPALDADLEVAGLGPDRTQISVNARYVPPFGAVGRVVDRAMLHRVAEATVKDFLDRLATRLTTAEVTELLRS